MATIFWKPGVGRLRPVLPGGKTARITAPGGISLPSTLRAGIITTGQLLRQPYDEQIGSIPIADGQGWRFPLPGNAFAMTDYKRRVETQWQVDEKVPHYKYGSIVVQEFTINGSLGAAAQPTTQDHWHVVSQLYGPSDNPADMWGSGFVSHGVSIKNGKIAFSGGGAHPGQRYTQSGTYEYKVDLADYVDGKDYRIKIVAHLADETDGWFSVWCNGVLWSVGEQWHPEGMWNGVPNGNRTGVMWTKEPWNYTAMRNGIYRGTNSGEADRPTYGQSVKITVHYLSPGTQTPAAESAIPRYTTTFADNFAGSLAKWTTTGGVTIQGGAMSLRSDAAGSSASTTEFAGEGSMTQAHIVSRPAGDAHQATFRVQDAVASGNMVEFMIKGTSMKFRVGTFGQADPAWTSVANAYDWYAMQYVRLKESGGIWRFETSIDGFTWKTQGSAPSSWAPRSVRFVVSAAMTGAGTGATLAIDDVQSRQPEETATLPAPSILLDADYANSRFTRYVYRYPDATDDPANIGVVEGQDYGLIDDPANPARRVAFFDNYRGLTHGNPNPRVGVEGPRNVKSAAHGNTMDMYWLGVSFNIDSAFSDFTKDVHWLSLFTGAFGPPYTSSSPMSMGAWPVGVHGKVRLVLGNAGDLVLPYEYTIDTGSWYTVVLQFRFAYAADGGWVRSWIAKSPIGEGLTRLPLKGDAVNPYVCDTMGRGVNDAWHYDPSSTPNSSRLGAYSAPGSRARVLYGHHRLIGTSSPVHDYMDLVRRP